MKTWLRRSALILATAAFLCVAAVPAFQWGAPPPIGRKEREPRLPNGRSQREAILKADWEANLKDTAALAEISQQLKEEMEKSDRNVLSLSIVKKTDEIEKLIKRIRSRMHRS
jgi:hypothetical protein